MILIGRLVLVFGNLTLGWGVELRFDERGSSLVVGSKMVTGFAKLILISLDRRLVIFNLRARDIIIN